MADRGQAEVLGYLLVFSLIVLAVALVSVSGQAGLADLRDDQRTTNAERGFSVLADNVDDLVREGVPSRATELELSGERLSLGPPVTVNVTATDAGGVVFERTWSIRPLVFRTPDGDTLVYESGAVIRSDGGGSVVVREPRLALSGNRTVLPVVNTTRDTRGLRGNPGPIDRESRVLVRTERRSRGATVAEGVNLTLTVDSPRANAWEPVLERAIDPATDVCTVAGGSVSCTYGTDHATVVATRVAVGFE